MNDVANHPKVGTARGCISRNSGIPKEIMDALQGHGEEGMSRRYGKGYVLRKLAEAMELWVNLGDDGLREAAYRGG
jgi:hypothetical protein